MDASFVVTREPPERYAISSPRQGEAGRNPEHDRLLRERALQCKQRLPWLRHVCIDRDYEELRIGPSFIQHTASHNSLERIYFHQLRRVSIDDNYVRIETSPGGTRYFSGSKASRTMFFDLLSQQLGDKSSAARSSSAKEWQGSSLASELMAFLPEVEGGASPQAGLMSQTEPFEPEKSGVLMAFLPEVEGGANPQAGLMSQTEPSEPQRKLVYTARSASGISKQTSLGCSLGFFRLAAVVLRYFLTKELGLLQTRSVNSGSSSVAWIGLLMIFLLVVREPIGKGFQKSSLAKFVRAFVIW